MGNCDYSYDNCYLCAHTRYLNMTWKIDDVAFWIFIAAAIAIIIWLVSGSPSVESGLISISVFIVSSELFLWKKYFQVDKNTAVSFTKFKSDIDNINKNQEEMNTIQKQMKEKLNIIETLLKKR